MPVKKSKKSKKSKKYKKYMCTKIKTNAKNRTIYCYMSVFNKSRLQNRQKIKHKKKIKTEKEKKKKIKDIKYFFFSIIQLIINLNQTIYSYLLLLYYFQIS